MCKFNPKNDGRRIDPCLKEEIKELNQLFTTLACCCGHGKYPKTIIIKSLIKGKPFEIFSRRFIPRKKRFYKKDKQGYYYIPETIKEGEKDD